MQHSIKDPKLF